MNTQQAFQRALEHHQSGRLQEAETIYRQILAAEPQHAEALHYLGIIAHQVGRNDVAVELIRQAIAFHPTAPALHCNLGLALEKLHRFDEAIAAYGRAIALEPDCADNHYNLGNALKDRGQLDDAVAAYRQALQIQPDHAMSHNNLGHALRARGDFPGAIAACRRALQIRPDYAEAHGNLGNALRDAGQLDEAIGALRRAAELHPALALAHYNLGNALQEHGRWDEAVVAYQRAIELAPDAAMAHNNLGTVLKDRGDLPEAMAAFQRAILLQPDYAMAHYNLGNALREQGLIDEAIAAFSRAIELKPDYARAHSNLAGACKDQGRLDEAITAYRRALAIEPDAAGVHSDLVYTLHFHPDHDDRTLAEEQQCWNRQFAEPLRQFILPHGNDRDPERRLRIGYVSPDFRNQAEAFFVLPLLESHDHGQFEIHCYSSVVRPDFLTERHRRAVDVWHDVPGRSDSELAVQIRADGIDILVDLTMHMAGNRLPIFARKPAPVQVTWLAYPGSTGLAAMDYRLTDSHIDPPSVETPDYSEESVRLPDCWVCYDPLTEEPPCHPLPAATTGRITFGSLNNFCKVNEAVLALWGGVLGAVAGSRLILLAPAGSPRQRILNHLSRHGVEAGRIEFVGQMSRHDYLSLYHRIDIALDTLPYNGITTTCDALWMGVPVVSLAGRSATGRVGRGLLATVGLPELATDRPEDFIAAARDLSSDLPRLADLRAALRARVTASPLMDGPRFARHVEAAYRQMWRVWCDEPAIQTTTMSLSATLAQAQRHHHSGRLAEAESAYRQILATEPHHAEALHQLGLLAHQTGHHQAAADLLGQAAALAPENSVYQSNLATVLFGSGRIDEAITAYRRTVQIEPDYAGAHNSLGHALTLQGQFEEAVAACRRALELQPDYAMAHNNLANALMELDRRDEAIAAYRQAIHYQPDYAEALHNLASALKEQDELEEVMALCQRAIQAQPDFAGPYQTLGDTLMDRRRVEEAVAIYRRATQISDSPELQSNLGLALCEQGHLEESLGAYRRALELNPQFAQAHCNSGNTLEKLGRPDEAIAACRRAIEIQPTYAMAYNNLGNFLTYQGRLDEALAAFQRALEFFPGFPMARWNRSLLHLRTGDFAQGWAGYEARWETPGFTSPKRNFPQPMWDGGSLAGQRILLHAEQGFGDSIQFIRYASLVAALGGTVLVECPPPLAGLFGIVRGVAQVIPEGAPLPPFDCHAPMLSLPLLCQTTLQTVPAAIPYLTPDPQRCLEWRDRLGLEGSRLKVGIAWSGNPKYFRDRLRSIALSELLPLLSVEGVDFISLQKDGGSEQIRQAPAASGIIDHTALLRDFSETAALLAQLDLVISVDTAVAHLAGALGRPVWTLLPYAPDWRWMLERSDSPWYPTMRLFRQERIQEWAPVIGEVRAQLQSLATSAA